MMTKANKYRLPNRRLLFICINKKIFLLMQLGKDYFLVEFCEKIPENSKAVFIELEIPESQLVYSKKNPLIKIAENHVNKIKAAIEISGYEPLKLSGSPFFNVIKK